MLENKKKDNNNNNNNNKPYNQLIIGTSDCQPIIR